MQVKDSGLPGERNLRIMFEKVYGVKSLDADRLGRILWLIDDFDAVNVHKYLG